MQTPLPKIKPLNIKSELNKATRLDPGLASLVEIHGYPDARTTDPGFESLAKIINSQQLSTLAASAIWNRLNAHCRGKVTARKICNRDKQVFLDCGLSRQKISYITELAQQVEKNSISFSELHQLDDDEVIDELVKHRGIGVWTAEIYAMFALSRADFYPAGDLALRVALGRYMGLAYRPDEQEVRELSRVWSPHRTSVSLLMWRYYGSTTLDSV